MPRWLLSAGSEVVGRDEIADPHALPIRLLVNGEVRQQNSTANLVRRIPKLIAEISEFMTLHAGDVLITGTPKVASTCSPATRGGDRGLGRLCNTIVAEEPEMKHARIRYQGDVHAVSVEANNAVRLADGRRLGETRSSGCRRPPAPCSPSA
jgi:2-keto-4-pentenoate hydratase/2-oxohepta-3-ene-1,7-dioic acid hydratase in catechol pathway